MVMVRGRDKRCWTRQNALCTSLDKQRVNTNIGDWSRFLPSASATMSCPIGAPENAPSDAALVAQNPLDPSTFVFPQPPATTTITIEFCDRVRWRCYPSAPL
jgi:hypothetical protein